MNWKTQLPEALHPHLPVFLTTERPYIRLDISKQAPTSILQSYLGDIRYWPTHLDWPTDENGTPLYGLLQLNLSELPTLPELPKGGILQFFISDNAFWGADPLQANQQNNFRIIYHKSTDAETIKDFSFLPPFKDLPLQAAGSRLITGTISSMPMPPSDYRFPSLLGPIFDEFEEQEKWELLSAYRKSISTVGHRVGGYAGFAQDDFRREGNLLELLLQLDSDPESGLLWGDYGVAHWFSQILRPSSNQEVGHFNLDEIWYAWECA